MDSLGLLNKGTQYILCSVSMALTALFAVSFTGSLPESNNSNIIPIVLMVLIGIGIDSSKYIFWSQRSCHLGICLMSLVLVAFSCAASIAFFVTQENKHIQQGIEQTFAYRSHMTAIDLIESEIKTTQKLLDNRLNSRYHDQWDKGAAVANELTEKRKLLRELMTESSVIGVSEARRDISTASFFVGLAEIFDVSFNTSVTIGYAILAMLIEASALGMIALTSLMTKPSEENVVDAECFESKRNEPFDHSDEYNLNRNDTNQIELSREEKIIRDISLGVTEPLVRQIIKKYHIQHAQARDILEKLAEKGTLYKQGKIYKVTESAKDKANKIVATV